MKRIIALIALILAPALSFAQTNAQQNEAGSTFLPSAGQISSNIAVDRALRQIVTLSAGVASATNPIKLEDSVAASGDAGIPSFSVAGTDAVVRAGSADYINPLTDLAGRTIVAPSPVDSYFNACSGTVTDTTTTDIRPAQVGLRNYISSITCSNTSAVQSRMVFRDGVTAVAVGAIPTAANGGNYSVTFPTPIRGSTNTAFRFELATTATSTQCCAQGFSVTN